MKPTLLSMHVAIGALSLWMAAPAALAQHSPIDPVSNPHKLDYQRVEVERPEFKAPFARDGVVSQPQHLRAVAAGLPAAQVKAMLGEPLKQVDGPRGQEWDYNFKFRLPESQHYMVCQYKVVLDTKKEVVRETSWRRQQCLNMVQQATAARAQH